LTFGVPEPCSFALPLAGVADSPADVLPPNTFLIQFVIFFISVGFSGLPEGKSAPELPAASPVQQGKSEKFRKNEFFSCGIPQFRPILITLDNHTNPTSIMRHLPYTLIVLAAATGLASAQATSYTTPVGYVVAECLQNSDTIVGAPLRSADDQFAGALSADPDTTTAPGFAILTIGNSPNFAVDVFKDTHYLKFTSGADQGKWFTVAANDAGTITVDLNGDTTGALSGDKVSVIKFWTLGELFDPADSTTDPLTTGNAIVASTSALAGGRRTEVLLPNIIGSGTNLSAAGIYYIFNGAWRKAGSPATDNFNAQQLPPDNLFTIRHPAAVTSATEYTISGEVDMGNFQIPLATQASVRQDNHIALLRPVDVTLDQLNLGGTAAFVSSTSALAGGRRDELLVFDNAVALRNKSASAVYYYFNGAWRKAGSPATDPFGSDVIPGGYGFIVRKYQSGSGATVFWNNTPSYAP
jgi:uncharacterized protein (TIGR02597 family)